MLKPQCVTFRPWYIFSTPNSNARHKVLYALCKLCANPLNPFLSFPLGAKPLNLGLSSSLGNELRMIAYELFHGNHCFHKANNWYLNKDL